MCDISITVGILLGCCGKEATVSSFVLWTTCNCRFEYYMEQDNLRRDRMKIETLKAALALLECAESKTSTQPPTTTGRKVIVRSRDAGVLYGELLGNEGSTVYLKNARQLWKWFAAKGISLVDVATYGVDKGKCKFSEAQATVTIFNACALIYTTEAASISIEGV